jgi:hypothetical protein
MISERQGFVAMRLFLEHFYDHAGNDMATLLTDLSLLSDGGPTDPAAWEDWLDAVEQARSAPE